MPKTAALRTRTLPDSPVEVLRAMRAEQEARRASEVRSMELAAHWVAMHPAAESGDPAGCFQSPKTLAGEGSPQVDEFCIPEVAAMLGMTCDSVGAWLTDVVELRYRLPNLWAGVLSGGVTPWRARMIAQTTLALTVEAASYVDEQTAWCANRVTPSQLRRLVDHARARFMPDELAAEIEAAADKRHVTFTTDQVSFDGTMHLEADLEIPDALGLARAVSDGAARLADLGSTDTLDGRRATALGDLARHQLAFGFDDASLDAAAEPDEGRHRDAPAKPVTQIVLHAHLPADALLASGPPAGVAMTGSVEQVGTRVLSVEQIRAWCGRSDVQVIVRPVIDLHERLETAGYTPTTRIRDFVIARDRTCVFPWCGRNARGCDLDHVVPFDHTDPTRGGPTSTDNLAPLCRRHHRLKTHGRWRYAMTSPGEFVWTSPLGHTYLRDHTGSRPAPDHSAQDQTAPDTGAHPPDQ